MGSEVLSLPKINFSGLVPGTSRWETVEGEVMKALETYGCFEALYDNVTPELREALFGSALPEVFSLPSEVKNRDSDDFYKGYIDRIAESAYETFAVEEEDIEGFTKLMWPQGNSSFSDAISAYKNHVKELEQMIASMIFHSLRIENYFDSYIQSAGYKVRMSAYGANEDTRCSLDTHIDPNLLNLICQHQVEGLEVLTREGECIRVLPLPNSFTVTTGEAIQAWSNGRLKPVVHRVRVLSKEKRYSLLLCSIPKDDSVIKTPEELVDDEHPLLYKPYVYGEFFKFRYSGSASTTLKDFCGISGEEVQA